MKIIRNRLTRRTLTVSIGGLVPTLALFALPSAARAQTWAGTLNGTTESWNVNANWSPATFPNAIGASANLNVDFTANKIISLQQAITVGSLTLGDSSGTSTLTINSGTGTNALTFDASSGNATLTTSGGTNTISANTVFTDSVDLSNSSTLTLSGTTSGAGTLNKLATAGSLTISGNNTSWNGGINHRQGTMNIGGSANAVLGTGTFTFANLSGGSGNTLSFNAANSRTIGNDFVNDNAAAVPGTQFAQISFSGGVTGNRVQTFTGTFSTGANYFTGTNPQSLVLEAQGSAATTADEGTIVLQGSWSGYSAGSSAQAIRIGANSSSDGGTILIDSASSLANSGGYQIQGNGTTVGTKLILNGAYTMANNVNFAGATGGARSSFGSRNATSTTATLSGSLTLSDADGANLFSQTAGATLLVSGAVTGSGPLEINRSYTYSTAGANTTETPTGTVELSRAAGNSYSGGTTVTGGTLLVSNTTGSATGSGTLTTNGGTFLGGTGAISGATTVNGNVNAGNGGSNVETLAFGSTLTLSATSTTTFNIGGTARGTGYDGIDVAGSLTNGGALTFDFSSAFLIGGETFDLFALSGGQTSSFTAVALGGAYGGSFTNSSGIWTGSFSGFDFTYTQSTGDLSIISAVPEPSSVATVLGLLGLVGWRERRKGRLARQQERAAFLG